MTPLTRLTLLRFFREGRTGGRRLTQIGGDERSHKGRQRTQSRKCVEPVVKVGTANSLE